MLFSRNKETKMAKRKNQFVNARGQVIDTDDDVCPPNFGIRTSMMMLDGLDSVQRGIATRYGRRAQVVDAIGRPCGNRPGHAFVSTSSGVLQDAAAIDARDIAYAELEKRSAVAWRTNVAVAQTNAASDSSFEVAKLSPADARDSAFAELEKRSANAWRGGQ
jgi:hypothetical protein